MGPKSQVATTNQASDFSIVWLVYDYYKIRYSAMKVLSTECYGSGYDLFELELLEQLQENESNDSGHSFLRVSVLLYCAN